MRQDARAAIRKNPGKEPRRLALPVRRNVKVAGKLVAGFGSFGAGHAMILAGSYSQGKRKEPLQ